MPTVPNATTRVVDTAGALARGLDVCCILTPCATSADITPRQFGSAQAVLDQHGYCEGAEYAALHADRTGKSFIVIGLPIATVGTVGRVNTSGNTNTSVASVAAGASGSLTEHTGRVKVAIGGIVGTDSIVLLVSADDGRTYKRVRLGTATSYVIPYIGATVSFAAGSLTAGDTVITWFGSAPRASGASITAARVALAATQKSFRSMILMGDVQNAAEATAFYTELAAYETANKRFIYGRAAIPDRLPLAALASGVQARMTGTPTVTFVTATTATRSAGSFITDGFAVGDMVTFAGTASNNVTLKVTAVSALVLTFAAGLLNEGPVSNVTVTSVPSLVFAATTSTRNRGSWLDDGFRVGDSVTFAGTVSNNGVKVITALSATVLTFASGGAVETVGMSTATASTGQTKAAWMAAQDLAFSTVDAAPRLDLSAGRGRVLSPLTGWSIRRSPMWAASIREYQHDLHIATWRKSDGPVNFDLFDTNGNLVEWDDRVDGGAGSTARFTTFRTWSNGPEGAFITQSLTRATEGSLLQQTHNEAVVNLACTTCQLNTENVIGRSLQLNDNGTATADALSTVQAEVNAALELALLQDRGEGPRASSAVWTPATTDILNVPEALLTGVLRLNLNGTIHDVFTSVRVVSAGQVN